MTTLARCYGGLLLAILLHGARPATALDTNSWPQFRGPDGQGHSDSTGLPLIWSETNHVRWTTPIPGTGWSSPVILGQQIWMTTATESGTSLRAVCVDRESGRLVHDVVVFHVAAPGFKHALNSYASPSPILEDGRVYVHFGTFGTACLATSDAKVLWRNQELKLDHENGPGSSPALFEQLLIFPCDGTNVQYVAALDKTTGKLAWKTPRSGIINKTPDQKKAYSTPLVIQVNGQDQVICPAAEYLYAYEPRTGRELWTAHYPGFSNVPRPIFGHGLLYVCTGFGKPELWAVRADGHGDVSNSHVVWKAAKQVPAKPSPLLVGARIFLISDGGIATCLDALTGREIWQERIGGEYSASPVFADGRIYFCSHDGVTTVIEPGDSLKVLAKNSLADGFMASPAIAGNAFFLRTKTRLYRIEN